MSVNTLISPLLMLHLAMHGVMKAVAADDAPFEITAEFELPDGYQTMTADRFLAEVVHPAIKAAACRPWGGQVEFARYDPDTVQAFAGSTERGILGRLMQCYDARDDRNLARIDIRVPGPRLVAELVASVYGRMTQEVM